MHTKVYFKKHTVPIAIAVFFIFVVTQVLLVTKVFRINPFARPILPDGFCKDCNVILISLDTLRAKSLPCYGYEQNTSPNLCDFGKKSFFFPNAYSQSAYTLDSHFSIFTSLYPSSHKMTVPFVSSLSAEIQTLPQILKKNGFRTVFSLPENDPHLPLEKGLGKGVDEIYGGDNVDAWIENLDEAYISDNKFFAFLHTYEVHEPYIPTKENIPRFYFGNRKEYMSWDDLCKKTNKEEKSLYPERFSSIDTDQDACFILNDYAKKYEFISPDDFQRFYTVRLSNYWDTFKDIEMAERKVYVHGLYAAKIYELDLRLKKFFEYLEKKGLYKNTIVIITADHGEEFQEHGNWSHANNLYNEAIHVPPIIYVPNAKPQVIDKLTQSIDILPSLLHILGISIPSQVAGMDVFSTQENQFVISEHFADRKQAIITKEWKMIVNNITKSGKKTRELYDLKNDYGEMMNVADTHIPLADSLEKLLYTALSHQRVYDQKENRPFPTWIDEKQRKKLFETGYF